GLLEVVADDRSVRLEPRLRVGAERSRLAREGEAPSGVAVVEGLDAEAVARAEQPPPPAVPERDRPHPVEALDAVVAPLLVGGEDHLRVARGAEPAALRLELAPQLTVVVDLAVVEEPERTVLARERLHRLRAEVDDRQPAEAE